MTLDEQIKILELYRDGAEIEWRWTLKKRMDTWMRVENGKFNFADKVYREVSKGIQQQGMG